MRRAAGAGFTMTGPTVTLAPISWMVSWPKYLSAALVNRKKSLPSSPFWPRAIFGWLTGELINASGGLG
jgi:hypothetical protein